MKNLNKYNKEERILINDLSQNKLTLTEARERCSKLWKLIPVDVDLNPIMLNNLMKEKFGNDPDWNKYCKTFKINVSDVDEEGVERYINAVATKFKNKNEKMLGD